MARKPLEDIVDKAEDAAADAQEFETLDVSNIKVEVLPEAAAKVSHPFDGYPAKKIKIPMPKMDDRGHFVKERGKKVIEPKEFSMTDWVLHNYHADPVHQDSSNRRAKTYHSRSINDLKLGINSPNILVQFSTPIKTANGTFFGAFIPDPYVRCQLIFTRDKKDGFVRIDKRYMLLDPEQSGRLKRCFQQLIRPQEINDAAADKIMAGEEPAAIRDMEYGATEI